MFCPDHACNRWKLYEAAGTNRYLEILSTRKGLSALARLGMNEELLSQFSLAKKQTDREEGRTNNEGKSGEEEEAEQAQGEQSLTPEFARRKNAIKPKGCGRTGHSQQYIPHGSLR